jgi:hypothetical protein
VETSLKDHLAFGSMEYDMHCFWRVAFSSLELCLKGRVGAIGNCMSICFIIYSVQILLTCELLFYRDSNPNRLEEKSESVTSKDFSDFYGLSLGRIVYIFIIFFMRSQQKVAKVRLSASPCLSACNRQLETAEWIFTKFDVGVSY